MLIVISPAKTLDFETPPSIKKSTKPAMIKHSAELIELMKNYSPNELVSLMGVSHKIALLNVERYLNWHTPFTSKNAKQAILAFKGDVYTGLDTDSFELEDFEFAQEHLRILSGLYGILKPLDLMQAYRLEMGTKLDNVKGNTLYNFWGDQLSCSLNKQLTKINSETLINLASNEYFKAIDKSVLNAKIITPVFKDFKNGKYKIISFFAKKARGMMSAYIIKNRISDLQEIKKFDGAGYRFDNKLSSDTEWVFLRKEQ